MRKYVRLTVIIAAVLCSSVAFCQDLQSDEPTEVVTRVYDTDGEIYRESIHRYEYEHDANGNLTKQTVYEEQDGESALYCRSTYEYNDADTVIAQQSEYFQDGVLTLKYCTQMTYDENGNIILYEAERLVDGEMKPDMKTEMLYENNNIVESRYYEYQDHTETYELNGNVTNTYNEDNLCETTIQTPYGGSGQSFYKTVYHYDADKNVKYRELYRKYSHEEDWRLYMITVYSYNEYGVSEELDEYAEENMNRNMIYAYDNEGRLVERSIYFWDIETEDWYLNTIYTYSYDGQPASIEAETAPEPLILTRNFPNPFNPVTTIEYTVPDDLRGTVTLAVYDARGALVRTLVQEEAHPGVHSAVWDATDRQGVRVSNGVYFCRLQAGSTVQSHKMLLLK